LKPKPKLNQIVLVTLGRGYPKELHGDHWCYILKGFGTKTFIIPTTSSKNEEHNEDKENEMTIEIKDFSNDKKTILRFEEARFIDSQRINRRASYYDVKTSVEDITANFSKFLFV
jgi:hypothetical protein